MVKVVGRKPASPSNVKPLRVKADRSPTPRSGRPAPPIWLTASQKADFRRVVADMADAAIEPLTIDTDLLIAYVVAVDGLRSSAQTLAREGMMGKGRAGEDRRHPATIVVAQYAKLVDSLASSLGLTPASRQRMRSHLPPVGPLGTSAETPADYFSA